MAGPGWYYIHEPLKLMLQICTNAKTSTEQRRLERTSLPADQFSKLFNSCC